MAAQVVEACLEAAVSRKFLAIAALRAQDAAKPPRVGFTSLSESLGRSAVQLHIALARAVLGEDNPAVLAAACRAMGERARAL